MSQLQPRDIGYNSKTVVTVDVLKFFFCICIIALHTKLFSFNDTLYFLTRKGILRLAVPFFFVSSGYFLGLKLKKSDLVGDTIFSYCKRLLLPLCAFSIINIFLRTAAMVISRKSFFYIITHVGQAILFYPYGALWYVQACIVGALILIPFIRNKRINLALIFGVLLYVFALICNNYYSFLTTPVLKSGVDLYMKICKSPRNGLFVGFLFLGIGIKCADKDIAFYRKGEVLRKTLVWFIVSYLLYLAEVFFIRLRGGSIDDGSLYIMLVSVSPSLLCIALGLKTSKRNRITAWFEEHSVELRHLSTGMYFLHRPILFCVAYLVKDTTLRFVIVSLLAAVICLLAYRYPKSIVCRLLK